jgi:hypothetical protein
MSESLVKNAADESQVKEAEKKLKHQVNNEKEDMKKLLQTDFGRRVMWKYLEICGVFRSSWHASALIHFNEGKRDVGLHMIADITDADPDGFIKMMKDFGNKK